MIRAERIAWIVGGLGSVAAILGWIFAPGLFAHAWVAALAAWVAWPLGSMALLLVHGLTGGRWGEAARPGLLMGVATLPLILPAIVPVIFLAGDLYPWMHADVASHLHNTWYLNLPFFAARGGFYLAVWFAIAALILVRAPMVRVAPPSLILLAVTATFAAIDIELSMDPWFRSSVYGMLTAAEMGLLALSVATLIAVVAAPRETLAELGRLMLALVVLWIYLDFMQLLIVWESNLPHEAPYYTARMFGFWGYVMGVTSLLHFLIPFFLLIFPQTQRSRPMMAGVAGFLVAMHILRSWWTVVPFAHRGITWVDVACMASLCGIAAGAGLRLRGRPLLARRPEEAEALHHV